MRRLPDSRLAWQLVTRQAMRRWPVMQLARHWPQRPVWSAPVPW
jgi:hypothetical protein